MRTLFLVTCLFICSISKSQEFPNWKDSITVTITNSYKKLINGVDNGHGNGKFSPKNIKWLQSFMLSANHAVKDIEANLGYWAYIRITSTYDWNVKTQQHDIPYFELHYRNRKTESIEQSTANDELKVEFHADKKINLIEYRVHEYDLEDHILPQLKALGYTYNKSMSRFNNDIERAAYNAPEKPDRNMWLKNSANKLSVHIAYVGDKWYYLEIMR